jgi:hypothetical protein
METRVMNHEFAVGSKSANEHEEVPRAAAVKAPVRRARDRSPVSVLAVVAFVAGVVGAAAGEVLTYAI